jgi:DNA-binding NarL/FixJ family response regulator
MRPPAAAPAAARTSRGGVHARESPGRLIAPLRTAPDEAARPTAATVLVADPHAATRAGLRIALEKHGMRVAAEAGDAPSAVDAAVRTRPDVCLLALDIPGSGIAATAQITAKLPETAVVLFADSRDDADLFDAFRAGASGYLPKTTDVDRLPFALLGVLDGETALPRSLVTRLVEQLRERRQRRHVPVAGAWGTELTGREWEVLELMREGLTTAAIADRLFISPGTVRTHVAAVLRKLRVRDRDAAIRLLQR